jgi:hypothetical protein
MENSGHLFSSQKILLYVLKLYFFESKECQKKKREKNAGPHPLESTFHSIPFLSFLEKENKEKRRR